MSVEEAVEKVHQASVGLCMCIGWPDKRRSCEDRGCWVAYDARSRALDRLILEVQAAMPCYLAWDELLPEPWEPICAGGVYCPSCAAREKLKVKI